MDYSEYQHLLFERFEPGILLITINRPDVLNATNRPGCLSYFRFLDLVCNRIGVPMKPNFFRI